MTANTVAVGLGILAIIAGILILFFPVLLNIIVGLALIVAGAVIIYQRYQSQGIRIT